jgi:hypothetical protein
LDWLERVVTVVGIGLPFALAISAAGFLLTMSQGSAVYWTPAAFIIASVIAIIAGFVARSNTQLDYGLQWATGLTLLALPVIRLLSGGPGWNTAFAVGQPIIIAVDVALAVSGGWMLWLLFGLSPAKRAISAALQPAE